MIAFKIICFIDDCSPYTNKENKKVNFERNLGGGHKCDKGCKCDIAARLFERAHLLLNTAWKVKIICHNINQ